MGKELGNFVTVSLPGNFFNASTYFMDKMRYKSIKCFD